MMVEVREQEDLQDSLIQRTGKLKSYQVLQSFANQPSSSQMIFEEKKISRGELYKQSSTRRDSILQDML